MILVPFWTSLLKVPRAKSLCQMTTFLGGSFIMFFFINTDLTIFFSSNKQDLWEQQFIEQYQLDNASIIQTEGCRIPLLSTPEDLIPKIEKSTKKFKRCKPYSLLSSNKTHIWVEKKKLHYYNISIENNLTCCYKSFFRPNFVPSIMFRYIDNRVKYNKCRNFSNTIRATDEFVRVICGDTDTKTKFESFFVFAIEKSFEVESQEDLPYNVLILGIDGVSRINLHRTMPKTVNFLRDVGAVELLGYNKVGDNSFPNLIPLLLGISVPELKETCLPDRGTFDNCPMLWLRFRQAGFATALVEDGSYLGTFNYQLRGFKGSPTDYYLHTFTHQVEKFLKNNKITPEHCLNEKFLFKIFLDYLGNLTTTLKRKLFAFFWEVSVSHYKLLYPKVMDEGYLEIFKNMYTSGYLNETILFLISDHGLRYGQFRTTRQGYLEERLPFVLAVMPPSFRKEFNEAFKNLKVNSGRLTTPYDMHATLMDLINLSNIENNRIIDRSHDCYSSNRSISLFLPIPSNRTCKTAGINDHYCTCHRFIQTSENSTEAKEAIEQIVTHLNNLLRSYPQCAKLNLVKVIQVSRVLTGEHEDGTSDSVALSVVVRTRPGGGVFEGMVRRARGLWQVTGPVSRLNLYGDQSHCVSSPVIKLYCYCVKQVFRKSGFF